MYPIVLRTIAVIALATPLVAYGVDEGWVTVLRDSNRQVQIDRAGIIQSDAGTRVAWARMVLGPEEAAAAGYAAVHALNRYDCLNRSFSTLRRRYLDTRSVILREEVVVDQLPRTVARSGVDDRLWREICQPPSTAGLLELAREAERMAGAADARQPVASQPARIPPARLPASPPASLAVPPARAASGGAPTAVATPMPFAARHPSVQWSYDGVTGPHVWGSLRSDWALCEKGRSQSPLDLYSGLVVSLPPVEFDYRPTYFRVIDTGQLLRVHTGEGLGARIRGERYELVFIELHRPAQERVDGRIYDMSAELHHRAADGRMAVISIQFAVGDKPNPTLAAWLASLPLDPGGQYAPDQSVDLWPLLPAGPEHYLYSGSLTTPPCTEGVTRVVMKRPVSVSWAQLGVIAQLHPPSARPLQDGFGRRILESR